MFNGNEIDPQPNVQNFLHHATWMKRDAALHPMAVRALKGILVCDLPAQCYVIGTYIIRRVERKEVLLFNKSDGDTLLYDCSRTYTASEIESLIECAKREGKVLRVKALMGCVRFTSGYYLLVVKRRQTVARIGFNRIFEALDLELVSLCLPNIVALTMAVAMRAATVLGVTGSTGTTLQRARAQEDEYCRQFLYSVQKQNFFYSRTYDLTNVLQSNMILDIRQNPRRAKFVWNEFLLEPFFTLPEMMVRQHASEEACQDDQTKFDSQILPEKLKRWFVLVIQGSVVQRTAWCRSKPLLITLIARTSKNYAGARYFRRGINGNGQAANHVEIEQIVSDEASLHSYGRRGNFTSYVQVRGSVPLHWFQPPTQLPKPPIKMGVSNLYYTDTCKHFQELLEDYGAPIIVVNLLKQREKIVRESALGAEYKRAVETLIGYAAEPWLGGDEKQDEILIYREFDIRAGAQNAWNKTTSLAEDFCAKNGFFACVGGAAAKNDFQCWSDAVDENEHSGCSNGIEFMNVRLQNGVLRSNCLDCVDRTNLFQFFFGLHVLGYQLHALGLLHSPADISLSPQVQGLFLQMYLLVGDIVAMHYGGSAQVGAGVLNRGTGWDKMMGIKRLYNNILGDREKQLFMNLFLGRYQPCPRLYSPSQNPAMRVPDEERGDFKHNNGERNVEGSSSISKRVANLSDLTEGASDYYLVVKGFPQLPEPSKLIGWWKEPLLRFKSAFLCGQRKSSSHDVLSLAHTLRSTPEFSVENGGAKEVDQEDVLRELCLSERMAAVLFDTRGGVCGDSGGGGYGEYTDGKKTVLQPTSISTTSVTEKNQIQVANSKCQSTDMSSYLLREFICEQKKLEEGRLGDLPSRKEDHADPWTTLDDLLHHDHSTYPDVVAESVFSKFIESVRNMCDECEPENGLCRMQLEVLHKFGEPMEWGVETVVDALLEVAPQISNKTIQMLRQVNVTGRVLLQNLDTSNMEEKALIEHFAKLVKTLWSNFCSSHREHFKTSEACDTCVQKQQHESAEGGEDMKIFISCRRIASPGATCRSLQPFFRALLTPDSIGTTLRTLLAMLTDPDTGVPRTGRLRYRGGISSQLVPPVVVANNSFTCLQLHWWLLKESPRLGLTLHEHAEPQERSEICWQFVMWLGHAKFVIPIAVNLISGVFVPPPVTLVDIMSPTKLFTLSTLQESHVLNESELQCSQDLKTVRLKNSVNGTLSLILVGASALACARSVATAAFDALLYMQNMYLSTSCPDISHNPTAGKLLEIVTTSSAQLAAVELRGLGRLELYCFWSNVFNALYIHAWLATLAKGAQDFACFYNTNIYNVGGYFFSLNDVKNGILRGNKPPFYEPLPPFGETDTRLFMTIPPEVLDPYVDTREKRGNSSNSFGAREGFTQNWKMCNRILLVLIDTYFLPEKFEEVPPYNLRNLTFGMDSAVSSCSGDASNSSTAPDDSNPDYSRQSGIGASLWNANSIPFVAATWLSSWFYQRQSSKSVTVTNPCAPLSPESLLHQIQDAECFMLRSISLTTQTCVIRDGLQVPRVFLPLFVNVDEGNIDDFLLSLGKSK
uniref:Putative synaptojanin (N-terminal domain) n=1 Tax=Trypanosoma congolense (strain IL3000) TaxID=1068625 RepID=G0V0I9_TRYCI|nr:putative synaptojanin (N-terminal domain) [Trypanosoma congolense IL3000]